MGLISRVKVWGNEILTADDLNTEFNNILNNLSGANVSGVSDTVTAMRGVTDPGEVGTESLASSVAGEIQRLRKVLVEITGKTYWYETPDSDIVALLARFPVVEADIGAGAVTTDKLGAGAVTSAKIAASAVTTSRLANDAVTSAKIADGTITGSDIASSTITSNHIQSVDVDAIQTFNTVGNAGSSGISVTGPGPFLQSNFNISAIGKSFMVVWSKNSASAAASPNLLSPGSGSFTFDIRYGSTAIYTRTVSAPISVNDPIIVYGIGITLSNEKFSVYCTSHGGGTWTAFGSLYAIKLS